VASKNIKKAAPKVNRAVTITINPCTRLFSLIMPTSESSMWDTPNNLEGCINEISRSNQEAAINTAM
jgi:hypothetical protein